MQDEEKTIREITDRLWSSSFEEYLLSERFGSVCREKDIGDQWREFLEFSQDMRSIHGSAMIKNAFSHFLRHSFHSQQKEFPALLAHIQKDFWQGKICEHPLDEFRMDLLHLGYSDQEIAQGYSAWPCGEQARMESHGKI